MTLQAKLKKTTCRISTPQVRRYFRPEYFLRHLRDHHYQKWVSYDQLNDIQGKMSYFSQAMQFVNKLTSHFGVAPSQIFTTHDRLVDDILLKYFDDDQY